MGFLNVSIIFPGEVSLGTYSDEQAYMRCKPAGSGSWNCGTQLEMAGVETSQIDIFNFEAIFNSGLNVWAIMITLALLLTLVCLS